MCFVYDVIMHLIVYIITGQWTAELVAAKASMQRHRIAVICLRTNFSHLPLTVHVFRSGGDEVTQRSDTGTIKGDSLKF